MGGNSSKESRAPAQAEPRPTNRLRHGNSRSAGQDDPSSQSASDRLHSVYNSRQARNSRPDLSFLGIGGGVERDPSQPEARKETKAEREARRLERERVAREKERERSMKEEGVDGGYLVTLGTYTGPEDFSKPTVRRLMIERRVAPFWKGLNDHSESWTENQLVAVVRDLPLPAPDEKPPDSDRPSPGVDSMNPQTSATNLNSLTVPISSRSPSYTSETSQHLSPAHPAFSLPNSSPFGSPPSSSPFFRGRAKTLAALTSRNNSQADMTPQEIQLPKDPYVNRQAIEAFLYKDAAECPICFLYYPPYLNRTRCCDQPICSECFVQIKRPDPHPPEHHGDENGTPAPSSSTENPLADGANLISEPAACPYCVVPEFGVTYEPPPFRRGLAYQGQNPLTSPTSAMSSSSSLNSQGLGSNGNRRRTTSISASAATVITTDRIRPDWAKKLSDARAHALRRAAAATALHNAAYVLGNAGGSDSRGLPFGRRRRTMLFGDSPSSSGNHTLQVPEQLSLGNVGALLAAAERQGAGSGPTAPQGDLFPGRQSSRRSRMEDLEELMMMEAIRQSIAAEEERKKKEEKEAAKESKKEEKKKSKEAKKAEKAARKSMIYPAGINASSSSQIPVAGPSTVEGKGKAVDRSGLEGGARPDEDGPSSSLGGGLEHGGMAGVPPNRQALRQLSNVSSSASSVNESVPTSGTPLNRSPNQSGVNLASSNENHLRSDPPTLPEPLLNFRSLAEVIEFEDTSLSEQDSRHTANTLRQTEPTNSNRDRTDSGESSSTAPPPPADNVDTAGGVGVSHDASEPVKGPGDGGPVESGDGEIEAVPAPESSTMDILGKQLDVNIMDRGRHHRVTQ